MSLSLSGAIAVSILAGLVPGAWAQATDELPTAGTMIVVPGAAGAPEYQPVFDESVERIVDAAGQSDMKVVRPNPGESADREWLADRIDQQRRDGDSVLWLILIGHGTFDGITARFNLSGPDISAAELAKWLEDFQRPVVVVNCASASAPFLNALSGSNRVVVTATRSGDEQNYARFGIYFAQSLTDPSADLNKDGQTSLLENFLYTAQHVASFYETEGRLATEHPLLDDNGDQQGTPPDFFDGLRVTAQPKGDALPDGPRAHQIHLIPSEFERKMSPAQRAERDRLELDLERLRQQQPEVTEQEYLAQIEPIVDQLSQLYDSIESDASDTSERTVPILLERPEHDAQPPRPG